MIIGGVGICQPAPENLPRMRLRIPRDLFRRPRRDDFPPIAPPSGPISITQSADFTTSKLCSITSNDAPLSSNFRNAASNFAISSKCKPVVGSSRIYKTPSFSVRAKCAASFKRCASPPESVVADCPSRKYPNPISFKSATSKPPSARSRKTPAPRAPSFPAHHGYSCCDTSLPAPRS